MRWYRELFDEICRKDNSDRANFIESKISELRSSGCEELHIEGKATAFPHTSDWNTDVQDKLAKSVSGFANADGGLIFWGFKDGSWSPQPINDASNFLRHLKDFGRRCTDPVVSDLQYIEALKSDGSGYVVVLVPCSDTGPHQASMGKKETAGKYWERRSDSCTYLRHYEVAEKFGRRPHPLLLPEVVAHNSGRQEDFYIDVDLWNIGRGIAKWSSIQLRIKPPIRGNLPQSLGNLKTEHTDHVRSYSILRSVPLLEITGIIYPDDHRRHICLRLPPEAILMQNWHDWEISWRVCAEGLRADIEGTFTLSETMLANAMNNHCVIASFRTHENWGDPLNPKIPIPT